jgi:predicted nucleic acid-binding protein
MSAVAWYEFARSPRSPEQLALARAVLLEDGIVPFSEVHAERASAMFRELGSPRRRAADIAIATTAIIEHAALLTGNLPDFEDIPGLVLERVGTTR